MWNPTKIPLSLTKTKIPLWKVNTNITGLILSRSNWIQMEGQEKNNQRKAYSEKKWFLPAVSFWLFEALT